MKERKQRKEKEPEFEYHKETDMERATKKCNQKRLKDEQSLNWILAWMARPKNQIMKESSSVNYQKNFSKTKAKRGVEEAGGRKAGRQEAARNQLYQ